MNLPFTNEQLYPHTAIHRIGDVFTLSGGSTGLYVLAKVSGGGVCLISLGRWADRWCEAVMCPVAYKGITPEQWEKICGGWKFTYVGRANELRVLGA